ncbi:MAG: ATP-binding cassette domain-containing protein, partial [Candidatus Thorarchaeota archaeon]
MNLLEVKNLYKEYYKENKTAIKVLSNISFSVKRGECFVIIGPNGSGKTTLLRILGLLEDPTRANILYRGKDILKISRKEQVNYRRNLSYVKQKPVVRNTSVFNNIAYGLKIRGMRYREYVETVNSIIDFVGLKGMENENARALSGGEMQRVAIAMNFVIDPDIYLLDEVSANLDPMNIKLLEEFILKIK